MDKAVLFMQKFKITLMQSFSKCLLMLSPSYALKLTQKLLCKPIRKQSRWPKQVKQFNIMTRHGKARVYKYGEGKTVWLIHGWSGSAHQFWPLMQRLADKGYEVIAFDLPGHGQSQGHYSSLPKMIRAFDDVSASLPSPQLVVTHALGASVLANSQWFKDYHRELFLIAPVLKYYELLQNKVKRIGLDKQLLDILVHHSYSREKMLITELNALPKLQTFTGKIKVAHDKIDELSTPELSKKLVAATDGELITTNNLGHIKILKSRTVLNSIEACIG